MDCARGAFDECRLPMFIDRPDGEARECDSRSERMLQAMIWIKKGWSNDHTYTRNTQFVFVSYVYILDCHLQIVDYFGS